jgi:hypothetical protein
MTHATIIMVLSAITMPVQKAPTPETYTETVADGEILKVVPKGKLFTMGTDDHGQPIPLEPKRILKYYFRVAIKDQEVVLTQVPDDFGKSDFFDLTDQSLSEGYGVKRTFSLKPGHPVSFSFNVPGGGPAWTLSLKSIDQSH